MGQNTEGKMIKIQLDSEELADFFLEMEKSRWKIINSQRPPRCRTIPINLKSQTGRTGRTNRTDRNYER
jgi:hypothetical protein